MREKTIPLLTLQVKSICDHVGVWMNTCNGQQIFADLGGAREWGVVVAGAARVSSLGWCRVSSTRRSAQTGSSGIP